MAEEGRKTGAGTRVLAAICRACPVCMARRRWPESWFARVVRGYQRFCPACRAYRRLREGRMDPPAQA